MMPFSHMCQVHIPQGEPGEAMIIMGAMCAWCMHQIGRKHDAWQYRYITSPGEHILQFSFMHETDSLQFGLAWSDQIKLSS